MWFWLVSLLTFILTPLAFLFAQPHSRPTTAASMFELWKGGPLTADRLREVFPWASRTTAWRWVMHSWVRKLAAKWGAHAFTVLGFVFTPEDESDQVLAHEALHVVQQSTCPFVGPVGMYITYLLDVLQWWSWRKVVTIRRQRAPLAEQFAYKLTGVNPWG